MKVPRKVAKQVLNNMKWYSPKVFKTLCGITVWFKKDQPFEKLEELNIIKR
jgi:hypothetical protein